MHICDGGKNNVIEIAEGINWHHESCILIDSESNNCHISIGYTDCTPLNIRIQIQHGSNQTVTIGNNLKCWGG